MIVCLEPLESTDSSAENVRAEVIALHLSRENHVDVANTDLPTSVDLLNTLYRAGRLCLKSRDADAGPMVDVCYVPSSAVIDVISGEGNQWSTVFGSKIRKSVRSTKGAIFEFPLEASHSSIKVFITDWSPCPAACALAVHRLHPVLAGCPDIPLTGAHFTGHYARHPLTGDLLPVWTAEWVKADFGTGAVLVNPAHNETDLTFGRQIGLPIRFALTPEGTSDEPNAWPIPPVIKAGSVVRSGRYDGMDRNQAQEAYFEALRQHGLARLDVDRSLVSAPIATLRASETGAYTLFQDDALICTGKVGSSHRVEVAFGPVYKCADRAVKYNARAVVVSSAAMKKIGPILAGMLIDAGIDPATVNFVTVGPVNGNLTGIADETLRTALFVGGSAPEPINVNQGLINQVEGFFKSLDRCREELSGGDAGPPSDTISFLAKGDPKMAFQTLVRWQKDCLKSGRKVQISELDSLCKRFMFSADRE